MSFYSDFAAHYERIFPFRDAVHAFLSARLDPPDGRVLDVGCGTGHYCGRFAADGARAVGIDLDAGMIDAARASYPAATFRRLDMTALDQLTGPLDLAFCIGNVAAHVDESAFRGVLEQLGRLLRPSGLWVLQVVNWNRFLELDSFTFPPRRFEEEDLTFLREYRAISEAGLEFHTELRRNDHSLFRDSTRLFPLREERYLALHDEAGFDHLGSFADYAETPFDPDPRGGSGGMILVFRKRTVTAR